MRKKICHLEKEVLECFKVAKLSSEIKKHVSECSSCQNVMAVHDWMNQYKEKAWNTEMQKQVLPHPDTIWNRAFAKRSLDRTLVKKALRPLIYPQIFFYVVIIIGILFSLRSNIEKIGNIINSRIFTQILPMFFIPMIIILISMAFCGLVVAFERRKKAI